MPVIKNSLVNIPAKMFVAYIGEEPIRAKKSATIEWFQDFPYIDAEGMLVPVGISSVSVNDLFIVYADGRAVAFGDRGTVKAFPSFDRAEWERIEIHFDPKHSVVK